MANVLEDGDTVTVQGSTSSYELSRLGDVYACTCPAWRNQGAPIGLRTCKHLRAYLGDAVETARIGASAPQVSPATAKKQAAADDGKAPPILLAHKWETDHDPTGWWMSEKLDGVRAYWDGEAFMSRLGNKFYAPDWFIADLPADTLDGELWVGRKQFSQTISIVRSGTQSQEWKKVQYVVFDAPNARGFFEDRLQHAEKVLKRAGAPHARFLEHVTCNGVTHLRQELARVESLGGEGLMLRRPKSNYEVGRSSSLLKVKTFHDSEGRVIGHAPGTGKHKGRLGALIVELADGTKFNVGTGFSDEERENPPAIGATITFRYQELTKDGVPRFPSYVGERIDVTLPARSMKAATGKPATSARASVAATKPAAVKPAAAAKPVAAAPKPVAAAPKPVAAAPKPAAAPSGNYKVSLVHTGENKFWTIEVRGGAHYTTYGKLGSAGQTRLVDLGSATAAKTDADKRAQQKRKEGYTPAP
ncbi:MAG TPA: DNA ligase [Kofleriaceae bacterium]